MIHQRGISIPAIKKLLALTLCWNINECSLEKRTRCQVFRAKFASTTNVVPFHRIERKAA